MAHLWTTATLACLTLSVRFLLGGATAWHRGGHFRGVQVRLLLPFAYVLLEANSLVSEPIRHLQRYRDRAVGWWLGSLPRTCPGGTSRNGWEWREPNVGVMVGGRPPSVSVTLPRTSSFYNLVEHRLLVLECIYLQLNKTQHATSLATRQKHSPRVSNDIQQSPPVWGRRNWRAKTPRQAEIVWTEREQRKQRPTPRNNETENNSRHRQTAEWKHHNHHNTASVATTTDGRPVAAATLTDLD